MIQETKKIWMDGRFIDWPDAKVHVLTHTLHYGLGAFEGIRCYKAEKGPAIFRLQEHIDRLFTSCHILQLRVPYTKEELSKATVELIKVNNLDECYMRPIVYIGYGAMGLYPRDNPINVAIAAWPWGAYLGDDGLKNGIRLKTSSFSRHHVNVNMTKSKTCGNYVNSQLAKKEAISCGYDEGLLLDTEGYVSEGSGENIFIVRKGVLKTVPLMSILEGITRDSVIKIADREGIEVREIRFTRDELYIADEAFLTGTAAEITPIKEVDGRIIGNGRPGPITKKLQGLFFDIVKGKNPAYEFWLTYI
ncbi:MAG: branched-chain amino acid transaminase [Nitrospirae bacterium]|nr:branched-chain amino acid transaminase [Nitrospirota bacterium]